MAKKSIDSDLGRLIREGLIEGKSRKQLYEELSEIYIDKSTIREQLVRTVDPRLMKRYRPQIILMVLIFLLSFVAFIEMVVVGNGNDDLYKAIIIFVPSLISVPVITYCVNRGMLEFTTFPVLLYVNTAITQYEYLAIEPLFFSLSIGLGVVYTILAIRLRKKLLPHLTFFGPKRNNERQAIFEN